MKCFELHLTITNEKFSKGFFGKEMYCLRKGNFRINILQESLKISHINKFSKS